MIEYLLFDVDNTLYPASCGLAKVIGERMTDFVTEYLELPREEAHRLRKKGSARYGTTLDWLRNEHAFEEIDTYMETVHPPEVGSYIPENPRLREMLTELDRPRSVLTNGPRPHAQRVLRHLGIDDVFEYIFDVGFTGYRGKPYAATYRKVLDTLGIQAENTLLIDDHPLYLTGFRDLGGQVLLVDEPGTAGESADGMPVIRTIDELPDFLHEAGIVPA